LFRFVRNRSDDDPVEIDDLSHRYLWGPAVDQALADEAVESLEDAELNETLWLLTDHLGTPRDIVDNAGDLVNHKVYDAFGRLLAETESDPAADTPIGYSGVLFDEATNLRYHRARWSEADTNQFLSEDLVWDGWNRRIYTGNDPINFADYNGLSRVGLPGKFDELRDLIKNLPERLKKLTPDERAIMLDLAQLVLDVVGIFDPFGVCDAASAGISVARGKWFDALLSGISVLPYVGDLAEAGKFPKYLKTLESAIKLAARSAEIRRIVAPLLGKLADALKNVPLDKLPESISKPLRELIDKINYGVRRCEAAEPQKGLNPKIDNIEGTEKWLDDAVRRGDIDDIGERARSEHTIRKKQKQRRQDEKEFRDKEDDIHPPSDK
jgi:RHS repeat-associated protein